MKCLSFNCRGMASASKKLTLSRLFDVEPSNIILLQETLREANFITNSLNCISPGWNFMALDAVGQLGGLPLDTIPTTLEYYLPGVAMVSLA